MTEETENLVLAHLRHIRGAVDHLVDEVKELKTRVGRLEIGLAGVQQTLAEHCVPMNRIDRHLDRIE